METGTAKNQLSRELTQLSLSFQKTSLLLWPEGRMPSKVLIPLRSLAPCLTPCFLEPPANRQLVVGATGGSGEATPQ